MVIITEEEATQTIPTMPTTAILHQLTITIPIKVKVDTLKVDTIKEDITNAAKEEEAMTNIITINIDAKEVMIMMGMVEETMATIKETITAVLPIVVLVVQLVQPVCSAAVVYDDLQLLLQYITSNIDK